MWIFSLIFKVIAEAGNKVSFIKLLRLLKCHEQLLNKQIIITLDLINRQIARNNLNEFSDVD